MEENNNPNEKKEQNVNNNTNQNQIKSTQQNGGQPVQPQGQGTQPQNVQGQGTQVPNPQGQGTQIPNPQGQVNQQRPNTQGQGGQRPNMNQPPKKKSNAGIIIAIIIGVLVLLAIPVIIILAIAGTFIFNAKSEINKAVNSASSYYNNYYDDNKYNTTYNNTRNNTTTNSTARNNTINNTTANNTISNTTTNTNTSVNTTAKASTKEAPLKINQWGLAAKYVSKYVSAEYTDKSYIDVPVRITKLTRGDEATQIIKDWCDTQTFYKYQDPKTSTEWAVFEYEVDLNGVKFDADTLGTDTKISSGIKGLDGLTVKYNDISYSLITTDISGSDYKKAPGIYKGRFIVMLPQGCKDYLVKLGDSYNGSESYFRIEE